MRASSFALVFGLLTIFNSVSRADIGLLYHENYGTAGSFTGGGHAAIYLSRACMDTPFKLHLCRDGEEQKGIVVTRYKRISDNGEDFMAYPMITYIYGAEDPKDIPVVASEEIRMRLVTDYYTKHLVQYLPAPAEGQKIPEGRWARIPGEAFVRTTFNFVAKTSPEEDAKVIDAINNMTNESHFNVYFNNCSDFARQVLGVAFPGKMRRDFFVDQAFSTPKGVAKSLVKATKNDPDHPLHVELYPQLPSSDAHRSGNVLFAFENAVKNWKYAPVLFYFHPYVFAANLVYWETLGRFDANAELRKTNPTPDNEKVQYKSWEKKFKTLREQAQKAGVLPEKFDSKKVLARLFSEGEITNGDGGLELVVKSKDGDKHVGLTRSNVLSGDKTLAFQVLAARVAFDLGTHEVFRIDFDQLEEAWQSLEVLSAQLGLNTP